MKAALIIGPGRIAVRDVHEPEFDAGGYDARCSILFGGICSGTDQHLVDGCFPWMPKLPAIIGHESIGVVTEVGKKVRHLRVGELVTRVSAPPSPRGEYGTAWGGFAEIGIAKDYRAMREDGLPEAAWSPHRTNEPLPSWVDAADATMMITWKETLSYSRRIGIGRGTRLLIIGSGGNGLAFACHAAHLGAKAVAMVGTSDRAETALAIGVTSYRNYRQSDPYRSLLDEFPDGFDVIIDSLGKIGDGNRALPLLKAGGTFALYGLDEVNKYGLDKSRARGQFRLVDWRQYDEPEFHADVLELMRLRVLRAHHWIDRSRAVPLDHICEAIVQVRQRVVIKPLVSVAIA